MSSGRRLHAPIEPLLNDLLITSNNTFIFYKRSLFCWKSKNFLIAQSLIPGITW